MQVPLDFLSVPRLVLAAGLALSAGVVVAAVSSPAPAQEEFLSVDANGDGFATLEEAVAALITTEAFDAADQNHDGKLDLAEYLAARQEQGPLSEDAKASH